MHRILIIEDEAPARKKLMRFINETIDAYEIVGELETVTEVKDFLSAPQSIDLIFSDIELRDGNVFEVYNEIDIRYPIIFITAYNEFLMNAFEANGIAYLLKPFSIDKFTSAWNKYLKLQKEPPTDYHQLADTISKLLNTGQSNQPVYKDQFAIKSNKEIYFLQVSDIVYFQANEGVIFAYDHNGKRHIMPQASLKDIEAQLNDKDFFRINRAETMHRKYINKLERFSKNIVSVYLNQSVVLKTSQNRTGDFNQWLGL